MPCTSITLRPLSKNRLVASCGQRHRWVIGTIALLAVLVGVFTRSDNPFAVDSFNATLLEAFAMLDVAEADRLLMTFTPMMLVVVVLLMCAAWATLSAEVGAGEAPGLHLRNQTRYINTALFAGDRKSVV